MVLTRAMVKKGVIGEKLSATDAHVTRGTKFTGITIGTLNIVDGRGNRLEMACHKLSRHNVDIAVIKETKLNGYHTVSSYGYSSNENYKSTSGRGRDSISPEPELAYGKSMHLWT